MTSKPSCYRKLLDKSLLRKVHHILWASIVAATIAALPFSARADGSELRTRSCH